MTSLTQNQIVHPFFTQAESLNILEQTTAALDNGKFNYTAAIDAISHCEIAATIKTGQIYVTLKGRDKNLSKIWFDTFLDWFEAGQITGIGEHYFISMLQAGLKGC